MNKQLFCLRLSLCILLVPLLSHGQIDPERRQLIQFGYNQAVEGKAPLSAYAFYFLNAPDLLHTNVTLRLAVAPVYMDSEIGFRGLLGPNTDLGIGFAGGGFADTYQEVRGGQLYDAESFTGHGAEASVSIYHRVNPTQMMPLNLLLRVSEHYSVFVRDDSTAPNFQLPPDVGTLSVRTGFRLGGREPVLSPDLAAELSVWYEGEFRSKNGGYGYNADRDLEANTHLVWGRALFIYTLPESKQNFSLSMTAGTSLHPDRFSAYRLGGALPLASEFPLILPGFYYHEISARRFALFSGQYSIPLDSERRWNITTLGSIGAVSYLPGLELHDHVLSGGGGGIGYRSPSDAFEILLSYSYGINAVRSHGYGASEIGLLCQIDLEAGHHHPGTYYDSESPNKSRGLFRMLFGD